MTETMEERLARLARPDDLIMKYVEQQSTDGGAPRSISLVGVEIMPLGYPQLAQAKLHLPVTVPLDWSNAKIVETNVDGVDVDQIAAGNATLQSTHASLTVSLVPGGWLPSGLAMMRSGTTVVPDRNVLTQIRARYDGGAVIAATPDFLDILADSKVRINPLLFAMEGNARRIPSANEVRLQLEEASALIRKALPKAVLVLGDRSLEGALGLIEDTRSGLERKQAFLGDIALKLTPPTSRAKRDVRWSEVLQAADRFGVPRNSLLVLAALSAVAVPNSASPAKKILKLHERYGIQDAYNALVDIRSLEIFMSLLALFPQERPAFFTADKPLALFWAGIRAHAFRREGAVTVFDLAPVEDLLPGATLEKWKRDATLF